MPRLMRSEVLQAPPKSRVALVASATNFQHTKITSATGQPIAVKSEQWNKLAWEFFDTVAEYRYAVEWVGNLLSRATLTLLQNGKPSTDADALEIMDALFDGADGQAEMLRQLGIHFTVTGDAYLVAADTVDGTDWFVAAASEIRRDDTTGDWTINGERFEKSKIMVIRLWRPHPQKRQYADSPTRPSLPILSEIDGLSKHVAAQIDSRLAGAGILFIPNDISFGSAPTDKPDADDDDTASPTSQPDQLIRVMIEAASASMADRQHPSSLIPIIIQADGEAIKNVQHLTFSSPLEEKAKDLRNEAIRRLSLGMDMPPEILTGTGEMNHWGAWELEEAAVKAHTEPLLKVITEALTRGYLRPLLKNEETAGEFSIGVDTTGLRLRPNRSKEAIELWDRGELKGEVMIRENGFDPENEMMDDKERVMWFLRKVSAGSTTPDIVLAALRELKVPLNNIPQEPTVIQVRDTISTPVGKVGDGNGQEIPDPKAQQAPAPRSLDGHPVRNPPTQQAAALHAAATVIVYRALERAGNRIKSRLGGKIEGVRAADLYQNVKLDFGQHNVDSLLEDAWEVADVFAGIHGVDPAWLTERLDTFTRDLIRNRKALDPAALATHLALK